MLQKLEVHIGTHAACHSECSSYCRCDWHDELKNQLPSIRFISCTHNRNFLKLIILEGGEEGLLFFTKEFKSICIMIEVECQGI